jgi:hypothetical protein
MRELKLGRLRVYASFAHWRPNGTKHGPQSNPQLIALSFIALGRYTSNKDFAGRRLWVYLRGGYAFFIDAILDRRPKPA